MPVSLYFRCLFDVLRQLNLNGVRATCRIRWVFLEGSPLLQIGPSGPREKKFDLIIRLARTYSGHCLHYELHNFNPQTKLGHQGLTC